MCCGVFLGTKACLPEQDGLVTHGCCAACSKKILDDAASVEGLKGPTPPQENGTAAPAPAAPSASAPVARQGAVLGTAALPDLRVGAFSLRDGSVEIRDLSTSPPAVTRLDQLQISAENVTTRGADAGTVALTPHERRVAEDRRDCFWLYVVTNCKAEGGPTLLPPIRDPARLAWQEVKKVEYYALSARDLSRSAQTV